MESKVLLAGAAGVVLASGFWLSHMGKPYQVLLLTAHKLVALGSLIYLAATLLEFRKTGQPSAWLLALCAVALVGFLALFVTGGLLSAAKPAVGMVKRIHAAAPYVTVAASAASFYMMQTAR